MVADLAPKRGISDLMVDAYAGIGIFAGTVGRNRTVTAVERSRDSLADAKVNLKDQIKAGTARIVPSAVERWRPTPATVVVADPARVGLGRHGTRTLLGCEPDLFVLVGCDHSAFARDAALLVAGGMKLVRVVVIDLFPDTSHVETLGAFVRT